MTKNTLASLYASSAVIWFATAYISEGMVQAMFVINGFLFVTMAISNFGKNNDKDQSSNTGNQKWVKSVQMLAPALVLAFGVLYFMDLGHDDRATRDAREICGAQGIDKVDSKGFFKHSFECN